MEQQLAVTAIGPDRAGLIRDLSKIVTDASGNILESRMIALGSEFAILMLISGNWHSIAKIREKLEGLQGRDELTLTIRDSLPRAGIAAAPYVIDVVSLDHEGIVLGLSNFFASKDLEIAELNTRRYNAPHTGAAMFSVQMTVNIPAGMQVSALRDEFLEYCDTENLDALMEPASR
ncbi:MAG: glycine cleavage system protein R [Gammaproteobacteria bacterium]|nr:glycine cleavage system protein R [Gammaproteobacteria bacterium]